MSSVAATKNPFTAKAKAYVALTKPRVIELLLITTVPTMILANHGIGEFGKFWWLVLGTLVGGALSAGSANAFNCYIDADIDRIMGRTKGRPLVTGELSKSEALIFAWILAAVSTILLWVVGGWLSAVLSIAAIAFYVLIYTMLLKRRTPQNIVWGGAAGCMPVLIGWSAVTHTVEIGAWVLFLIIFLWTPPHYWPLAMKYKKDYAAANVPMLPVVAAPGVVGIQIILYSWALYVSTLILIPAAGMGLIYSVLAVASGAWFLFEAYLLYKDGKDGDPKNPMRLFHGSITYLTIVFLAVALDPLIHIAFF
jgi:heme o synthase